MGYPIEVNMGKRSAALWAGTEMSLDDYLSAMSGAEAYTGQPQPEEDDKPDLLEIQGNVGVISIRGPLTNRDSWVNKYIGVTSYNSIREAMIYAAGMPDVKQILLDIDSGGGAVAGVADTANLIRMVNEKMKPVTAFTDGNMASAAYWLGSSAGKVYASKTAMVGSIGVIAYHSEQSKALEKAGINVTVVRAGKYKALANGVEPLTEVAKEQMQTHLDAAYKVFVQHVAEARNVSYDLADTQMAQGLEFMGEASVGAGLTDGVESYDTLFNRLSANSIDTSEKLIDNHQKSFVQGHNTMKRALTDIEIAAAAEGITLTAEVPAGGVDDATVQAAAEAAAAETPETAPVAETPEATKPATDVTEYLQAQLKVKDEQLLASGIELSDAKKQIADMEAAHEGLLAIAVKSLSNMQVALGGAAVELAGVSATQVLADHGRVSALFASKFKAGGVAAVDAAKPENSAPPVSNLARARLQAVHLSK